MSDFNFKSDDVVTILILIDGFLQYIYNFIFEQTYESQSLF